MPHTSGSPNIGANSIQETLGQSEATVGQRNGERVVPEEADSPRSRPSLKMADATRHNLGVAQPEAAKPPGKGFIEVSAVGDFPGCRAERQEEQRKTYRPLEERGQEHT
ncbi:hypothetical protein NDU88_009737 [Pleurodeles waltl]|uniref:Uncharacterized protein n=1 Tax=Pleurodeles waltl TaxID=8319 RepID=A0AAV7PTN8_PLEWA|nr:hypothetical protein NDU88_009737 [Pleurodeles waltl]